MNERNDTNQEANKVINKHVLWAMGAGLIPVPLLDIAAVTAIQMDMLKQLSAIYEVDYSAAQGKAFAVALTSSTFARVGAVVVRSMAKSIPAIGTVVGGVSMAVLSGASTYAVGKIAKEVFESGGDLLNVDLESAKAAYKETFERGKQFVSNLGQERKRAQDVFQALERLNQLREKGVINEEDFEAQKQKLLARL